MRYEHNVTESRAHLATSTRFLFTSHLLCGSHVRNLNQPIKGQHRVKLSFSTSLTSALSDWLFQARKLNYVKCIHWRLRKTRTEGSTYVWKACVLLSLQQQKIRNQIGVLQSPGIVQAIWDHDKIKLLSHWKSHQTLPKGLEKNYIKQKNKMARNKL